MKKGSGNIHMNQPYRFDAEQFIRNTMVWDNHVCIGSKVGGRWIDELVRAHNTGFSFVSVNVGDGQLNLDTVIRLLADFRDWVQRHSSQFTLAASVADIDAARSDGKTAVAFDLEGAYSLEGQINLVPLLYDLGVRWMLLAYNRSNWAAGGCHDEQEGGLTSAGIELIQEMDRVGMVKCCSHTSYRTVHDLLQLSDNPFVFSHSNARALQDHPRNVPDEIIKLCAASGGVVGVNGLNIFLGHSGDLVELMAQHIDHIVQLVGPEHVGLGLDYVLDMQDLNEAIEQSRGTWPPGYGYDSELRFVQPEQLPELVDALWRRGYGDEDLRAILGGNFRRVAQRVWRE